MNHYQLLFEVIERHTGKVLLQSEMDEVVSACELLNGTAALRAENAKLRSGLGAVVDMIEEMYELKDIDKISDRRYRKGRTAYLSTTPDPLYLASPEMLEALKNLVLMARTSGGTAGRDANLVSACEEAEMIIQKSIFQI